MSNPNPPATQLADAPIARGWQRFGSLPVMLAVLVALNAGYILFVAFGNITDFATNQPFVQHVLSMDTTNFGAPTGKDLDPATMWRAITDPTLQMIGYFGIIVWESATGVVLVVSFVLWIRGRGGDFAAARALSSIGLMMLIVLFVGGFIVVGGEWFQMWKSTAWNGLDTAFRNSMIALVTLVLIQVPSPYWRRAGGQRS